MSLIGIILLLPGNDSFAGGRLRNCGKPAAIYIMMAETNRGHVMTTKTAVIPAAGDSHSKVLPVSSNISDSMIPVNGKPIIGYTLAELSSQGFEQAVVVVKAVTPAMSRYVNFIRGDLRVDFVEAPFSKGVAHSVKLGMEKSSGEGSVVILGDTICLDPLNSKTDFLYYQEVRDPSRWCVVKTDKAGLITGFIDKPVGPGAPKKALIGVYNISDNSLFSEIAEGKLSESGGQLQLSSVFSEYIKKKPLRAEKCERWFDCGSPDTYFATKKRLLSSRSFNVLKFDEDLNTIRKESKNAQKLNDEISWYLSMPERLKIFAPRLVGYSISEKPFLEQEYYGYNTLSELFLFQELSPFVWDSILDYLSRIMQIFSEEKEPLPKDSVRDMYYEKTRQRLASPLPKRVKELILAKEVRLNGKEYAGWPRLEAELSKVVDSFYNPDYFGVLHGDLCFSNILCDPNNRIIKLIDPRGRFFVKGIHGDAQYERAKLRHSASGYEFIVNDMFNVKHGGGGFSLEFFYTDTQRFVKEGIDRRIVASGFSLPRIRVIEGTLFLSMIPYHPEKESRQIAMALLGIKLLNEGLDALGHRS